MKADPKIMEEKGSERKAEKKRRLLCCLINPALSLALPQTFLVVTFTIFNSSEKWQYYPHGYFFSHSCENTGHVDQQLSEGSMVQT